MDPSDIPLDSSDGLKALCKACMVPEDVTAHLISSGFVSVALLGHAISHVQEVPDFIDSLKLDAAGICLLLRFHLSGQLQHVCSLGPWREAIGINGASGEVPSGGMPAALSASKPKLTAADVTAPGCVRSLKLTTQVN